MTDFREIYAHDAERYHTLVSAEDAAGELPRALARVAPLRGARVIEVGMGTGRITRHLLEAGARVTGYEASAAMLAVARRELGERFEGVVADIRTVELPAKSAEVVVAGWCLGHFCEWYGERWQGEIDGVLRRLWEALDAKGTLIVIETLGTGVDTAGPPNAELAAYYRFLESTWGMTREQLPTDYEFVSLEAALASIGFFFGPELAEQVRARGSARVPEWTGLWWRRRPEVLEAAPPSAPVG
ncbi:MAG TPA: class I SAM-dependent methyltransferase [Polyangiaceae bacterium]|nr:class I SAM-dependent methyltransferase [Polyangiaceae bacterium]